MYAVMPLFDYFFVLIPPFFFVCDLILFAFVYLLYSTYSNALFQQLTTSSIHTHQVSPKILRTSFATPAALAGFCPVTTLAPVKVPADSETTTFSPQTSWALT